MYYYKKHTGRTRATISDADFSRLPAQLKGDFEKHETYNAEEPTHQLSIEGDGGSGANYFLEADRIALGRV